MFSFHREELSPAPITSNTTTQRGGGVSFNQNPAPLSPPRESLLSTSTNPAATTIYASRSMSPSTAKANEILQLLEKENSKIQRLSGTSVETVGKRSALEIFEDAIHEAQKDAHRALLVCQTLSKKFTDFLSTDSEQQKSSTNEAFARMSNLLSNTTTLADKFTKFEGLLFQKVDERIQSNNTDILQKANEATENGVANLALDLKQILENYKREIISLRNEIDTLKKEKWEGISHVKQQLRNSLFQFVKSKSTATHRGYCFQLWKRFAQEKIAVRKKKQRLLATEFLGRMKFGAMHPIFHQWMRFAQNSKERREKFAVANDALRKFMHGTSFGTRQLFFQRWKKWNDGKRHLRVIKQSMTTFLRQTVLGQRRVAFQRWKQYVVFKKHEEKKRTLGHLMQMNFGGKGLRVIYFRKWKKFHDELRHSRSLLVHAQFIRAQTTQGLQHVYFKKWKDWIYHKRQLLESGYSPSAIRKRGPPSETLTMTTNHNNAENMISAELFSNFSTKLELLHSKVILLSTDVEILQSDVGELQMKQKEEDEIQEDWKGEMEKRIGKISLEQLMRMDEKEAERRELTQNFAQGEQEEGQLEVGDSTMDAQGCNDGIAQQQSPVEYHHPHPHWDPDEGTHKSRDQTTEFPNQLEDALDAMFHLRSHSGERRPQGGRYHHQDDNEHRRDDDDCSWGGGNVHLETTPWHSPVSEERREISPSRGGEGEEEHPMSDVLLCLRDWVQSVETRLPTAQQQEPIGAASQFIPAQSSLQMVPPTANAHVVMRKSVGKKKKKKIMQMVEGPEMRMMAPSQNISESRLPPYYEAWPPHPSELPPPTSTTMYIRRASTPQRSSQQYYYPPQPQQQAMSNFHHTSSSSFPMGGLSSIQMTTNRSRTPAAQPRRRSKSATRVMESPLLYQQQALPLEGMQVWIPKRYT